jgi:molybdate transport system ATP-binding protein
MIQFDINKQLHNSFLNIDFNIEKNDFIAISGKSGVGKTTLLRIIAGLEKSDSVIKVFDTIWQDKHSFLKIQKRDIGFVFQDYSLFPNMSVLDNLLYVKDDKDLAFRLLRLTHIEDLHDKYPNNLSGGEQQRVAICRSLMKKPQLLLLDEPLSALDNSTRNQIQKELLTLHKEFNLTTILVSHNQHEIETLCNKQIFLEDGKITKQIKVKRKWDLKTPFLSADGIIKLYDKNDIFQGIVLISRLNEPYGLALPGGFVDVGEKVEDALIREMKEETNLAVEILSLQNIYSDPLRDPRFHTATAVYICKAYGIPKAQDDAKEVFVYKLNEIPYNKLVFDHKEILQTFVKNIDIDSL